MDNGYLASLTTEFLCLIVYQLITKVLQRQESRQAIDWEQPRALKLNAQQTNKKSKIWGWFYNDVIFSHNWSPSHHHNQHEVFMRPFSCATFLSVLSLFPALALFAFSVCFKSSSLSKHCTVKTLSKAQPTRGIDYFDFERDKKYIEQLWHIH